MKFLFDNFAMQMDTKAEAESRIQIWDNSH